MVPEICLNDFGVKNEPVLGYLKNSRERCKLETALESTAAKIQDVPIVIGEEEIRTSDVR